MKIFKFFVTKIFLRKILVTISVFALLVMSSYVVFTAAISVFSTVEGKQELDRINRSRCYVANLDPESNVDIDDGLEPLAQEVYEYLNANFDYAFYVDGFVVDVPNSSGMEVTLGYMNENYSQLNPFSLASGEPLTFEHNNVGSDVMPVLVGKGLSDEHPLGSTFNIYDPTLERDITVKVQGILETNAAHSNFYAPNSKNYFNFSIIVPVNKDFIDESNLDLKVNGLFDLIFLDTDKDELADLGAYIQNKLNMKLNFYSQEENNGYFNEYFVSALKNIVMIAMVMFLVLVVVSVWTSLVGLRLMIKDFTLNLLVGLSYARLRKVFYSYYSLLFSGNLVVLFLVAACSRYGAWQRKDSTFATYGIGGLISMDWFSLLTVLLFNIVTAVVIVEITMWRIKRVPISVGVLQ